MRTSTALCLVLTFSAVTLVALCQAQEGTATTDKSSELDRLDIIPLVVLRRGETKEVLFSTRCTVGVTRGGGFTFAEMRDGEPDTLKGNRVFRKQGVTISAPDFDEGVAFAGSADFAPLTTLDINAFRITVTASSEAQPGILEMHLVDATCSGHCKADFRVLVLAP